MPHIGQDKKIFQIEPAGTIKVVNINNKTKSALKKIIVGFMPVYICTLGRVNLFANLTICL